jgi:hypothetical protein
LNGLKGPVSLAETGGIDLRLITGAVFIESIALYLDLCTAKLRELRGTGYAPLSEGLRFN